MLESQKDYLRRYLSGPKDEKKKKKKSKPSVNTRRMKIVDDDIDPFNIQNIAEGDVDLYELTENAPQIAGIIDERPPAMQVLETFKDALKWRGIVVDAGNDNLKVDGADKKGGNLLFKGSRSHESCLIPNISSSKGAANSSESSGYCSMSSPHTLTSVFNVTNVGSQNLSGSSQSQSCDLVASTSSTHSHKRRRSYDSDLSPPRSMKDLKKKRTDSDSDLSPPRSKKDLRKTREDSDSDLSPPRSRKDLRKKRGGSDSDLSPPRSRKDLRKKGGGSDSDLSPPRSRKDLRKKRVGSDSDLSPPRSRKDLRKKREGSDSDLSPPRSRKDLRKKRGGSDSHFSPQESKRDSRKKRADSDSDLSPPRSKKDLWKKGGSYNSDLLPLRSKKDSRKEQERSDSDLSPPRSKKDLRKRKDDPVSDSIPSRSSKESRKKRADSDLDLPPRSKDSRKRNEVSDLRSSRSRKYLQQERSSYDSDLSLNAPFHESAKEMIISDNFNAHKNKCRNILTQVKEESSGYSSPAVSYPDTHPLKSLSIKKEPGTSKHTLDGKAAGLQDAKTLKEETKRIKAKEQAHFDQMNDLVSGRGAATIVRDRKTGKKRDLEQEALEQYGKKAAERERLAEFKKIGRGLVQVEEQARRVKEHMHEMNKPLARYADDKDLENLLKSVEREGDPMLEYLREKKAQENPGAVKPRYQGPAPPPNRFNTTPGHRWDGVDRSTGFEKKLFESKNAKKALEEEAYKWSVADM